MNKPPASLLSRRQFAKHAAVFSASASVIPRDALLPGVTQQTSGQNAESQNEIDLRFQQVVQLYGEHLNESQKANIKKMCADLQPTLERIRKFNLKNSDAPALFLKPLVEREKKSGSPTQKS